MSKIFDFDARKGSLIEKYQNSLMTVTNAPKFIDTAKGTALSFTTNQRIATTNVSRFQGKSKLTIVAWAKINTNSSFTTFFDFSPSSTQIIQFGTIGNGNLYCFLGNGAYERGSIPYVDNIRYHQFVMIFDGTATGNANKLKLFIDGVQQTINFSTVINATQTHSTNGTAYIGYTNVSGGYGNQNIVKVNVFDEAFTQSQIDTDYKDFLNSKPLKKATTNFIKLKPTELKENGLIAAYNMTRQGNTVYDISGNGNHLTTLTKALSTKDGIRIVQGMLSGPATFLQPRSISIRFKILSSDSSGLLISGLRWTGSYTNSVYVNGTAVYAASAGNNASTYGNATAIVVGQWATLTIVFDGVVGFQFYVNGIAITTSNNTGNYHTGYNLAFGDRTTAGGNYLDCEIADCRIYNRALSTSEITAYHNEFVQPTLYETFENNGADNIVKGIQGWTIASGTWKINENTVAQISGLKIGAKYLECATAGVIRMPSTICYGTWEFDWYKGNTVNDIFLFLAWVAGVVTAMTFRVYTDEGIYVRFNGAGGFQTASSYISNNTWYRTKITRTITGVTSVYIKGGAFGSTYQLVSTVGGNGTNPVTQANPTSSNTMYLDLDAGDRIANIKVWDGVII